VPTYQYSCTECGHFFEQVQSFSEDSLTVCPQCEGRLRKVFNAVGVVFKGSGFYRTDSRADSGTPAAGAGEKSGSGEKGGAGDKGGSGEKGGAGDKGGSSEKGGSAEKSGSATAAPATSGSSTSAA
jgi:putative FmdB family regulatory protein